MNRPDHPEHLANLRALYRPTTPPSDDGPAGQGEAVNEALTEIQEQGLRKKDTTAQHLIEGIAAQFDGSASCDPAQATLALAQETAPIDSACARAAEGERQRARKAIERRHPLHRIAAAIERISGVHKGTKGEE